MSIIMVVVFIVGAVLTKIGLSLDQGPDAKEQHEWGFIVGAGIHIVILPVTAYIIFTAGTSIAPFRSCMEQTEAIRSVKPFVISMIINFTIFTITSLMRKRKLDIFLAVAVMILEVPVVYAIMLLRQLIYNCGGILNIIVTIVFDFGVFLLAAQGIILFSILEPLKCLFPGSDKVIHEAVSGANEVLCGICEGMEGSSGEVDLELENDFDSLPYLLHKSGSSYRRGNCYGHSVEYINTDDENDIVRITNIYSQTENEASTNAGHFFK